MGVPSPSWGTNTHPQLSSLRLLETDVFMWGLQGVPADDMLSCNTETQSEQYTQHIINALSITLQNKHHKVFVSYDIRNSETNKIHGLGLFQCLFLCILPVLPDSGS